MKQIPFIVVTFIAISGCATVEKSLLDDYNGPIAKVTDSMANVDNRKGEFCVLRAVDGKPIANAIGETLQRGQGKGMTLYPWVTDRRIPAQPTKATLKCQTVYAAPILALTGTVYSVEGVVDFNPKPDGRYVVKGSLAGTGSSVWVEDAESGQVITSKVTSSAK